LADLERYLQAIRHPLPVVEDDSSASAAAAEGKKKQKKQKKESSTTPDGRAKPKFLPRPVYQKPEGLVVRPRRAVPRFTLAELYAPGNEKYAMGLAPYVLVGAMKDWPYVPLPLCCVLSASVLARLG
jgi:hypothetical protein